MDPVRTYQSRRGHAPRISISDTNHHVTEAIGGMYGSDDDEYGSPNGKRESRPLSFMPSPKEIYEASDSSYFDTKLVSPSRTPLVKTVPNERLPQQSANTSPMMVGRKDSLGSDNGPLSPPPLVRTSSAETAVQQFPLNDIDYESSPAAVAQELSNLQAIRRMSMNVDNADPDLPTFATGFGLPSPPLPSADEDDASRLFWVPARLHPELAPVEFKTFVEDRVERMRRMSGGDTESLSPEGLERQGSSGLKRKKSMLSRQIATGKGYEDGAERLERKRSEGRQHQPQAIENLSELENLVNDPSKLIHEVESSRRSLDDDPALGGRPIIPSIGLGLKRSTRTAYRHGSLRKGERAPFSKRAIARQTDTDGEESPLVSPVGPPDEPVTGLTRVQTEPTPFSADPAGNFSRPSRKPRPKASLSSEDLKSPGRNSPPPGDPLRRTPSPTTQPQSQAEPQPQPQPQTQSFNSRFANKGWTTAQLPGQNAPVPQIIEPPPPGQSLGPNSFVLPERKSSHQPPPPQQYSAQPLPRQRPGRPMVNTQRAAPESTLHDISSNPSPLPGSGGTRTDALTMVPTFEDKKDKKDGSRKPSWGWLLGGDEREKDKEKREEKERREDKEKERERERHRERQEKERKSLRKPDVSSKLASSDKTRFDVLQTSIDGGTSRGRESVVLDRESIKLEEERRKESSRRTTEPAKKEKEGILSSFFSRDKKSKEDTVHKKKHTERYLSPEPPPRILRPDVDYNWTRFSILEERAIYRMAHIKLANPKRALYSQVLLSNFMYSYLAKVQMMHPQMQIPSAQSTAQRNTAPQTTEEKQAEEYAQYQQWQETQARGEGTGTGTGTGNAEQPVDTGSSRSTSEDVKPRTRSRPSYQRSESSSERHALPQAREEKQTYLDYSKEGSPFDQASVWEEEDVGQTAML